jgi:hypothetical protein
VKISFMVKLYGDQSVSMMPARAGNTIPWVVDRALHHQARAGFGAKQAWQVERQNAVTEMTDGPRLGPGVRFNGDRVGRGPPFEVARNPALHRTSQPKALAILSGRQR